ncbi:enhancer of polycomb homolog 1 isoform X1 [Corythoichthys intestinalis]|uniref:enhancer of polycomb homolog 1 isoform X1 n=2 Tax=Corythoichthys intestinalis TaxID=161448 RepID=UPI0025A610EE|nr:enhancer of polycomb homolog 1 isoform X1 [Corythoichthys intestinalis]XP_061810052.1 enhancer of polycomb homolog 1-like isoform X2 [Nerophis lumbriciformis]
MSKLSFRARALDASKPLPVFRCEDLPDLHEYASINRAVPQMPTGMEKEEESEHHLQRAISAQQVYGEKRDNMVIPVPEAERNITHYESLYPGEFKMPKQLIHIQPFGLDTEQPDYDLDSGDETFVNKLKKKMEITALQFEEMIDRLEKGSGQQFVSLQEAKLLLKEDDELIKEVFDYWSRKRKMCKFGTFVSNIKQEKRDGSSTSDPYVAFRRRTEKMQTRKNRKNDEASYEKMLKLRRDLSRAVTILEMIKRREKSKREMLHLTLEVVEKRNSMPDFGCEVMAEALAQQALVKPVYTIPIIPSANQYRHQDHLDMNDYKKQEKTEVVRTKRKYEKKPKIPPLSAAHHSGHSVFNLKDLNQYDFPSSDDEPFSQIHSGSSEAEEESDPDGCYAFRRKAGCHYYASSTGRSAGWPWVSPLEGGLGNPRFRYCLTSLNTPRRCIGLARRRVGRGGRFLLDRAHADVDAVCHFLDSDPKPDSLLSLPNSPLRNSSTSEPNTSDPVSSSRPLSTSSSSGENLDLNRILLNIKSCRWRHFRPRTLSQNALETGDSPLKGFADFSRTVSGLTRRLSGGSVSQNRPGPATPVKMFTAEQYQQHQEQLAVMQKQQLEQSQHQQNQQQQKDKQQQQQKELKEQQRPQIQHANNSLSVASPLISQVLVSKTLDQATAQFAASALVTADQLLAFKSKEELVLAGGVNGVLGAGVLKGLHLSSTATALHPSPASAAPAFQPAGTNAVPVSLAAAPGNHTALGLLGCGTPGATASTQVLIGNNICLSVPSAANLAGRHLPRALPPSALKLAAATNLQKPKVSATPALDINSREKREEDKSSLSSIADNTVAMEVT